MHSDAKGRFYHFVTENQNEKDKESQLLRDQRTRDLGRYAPNPREDNYLSPYKAIQTTALLSSPQMDYLGKSYRSEETYYHSVFCENFPVRTYNTSVPMLNDIFYIIMASGSCLISWVSGWFYGMSTHVGLSNTEVSFILKEIIVSIIRDSTIWFTLLYFKMAMIPLVPGTKMVDVCKLISLRNLLVKKVTWDVLTTTPATLILSRAFGADCMTKIAYIYSRLPRTHSLSHFLLQRQHTLTPLSNTTLYA